MSDSQGSDLTDLFQKLDDARIDYVISRKYESLPESVPDDVDIYFREPDFDKGIEICRESGFSQKGSQTSSRMRYWFEMAREAIEKPGIAASKLINSPFEVYSLLTQSLDISQLGHCNIDLVKDDIHLDIRNNLAYKSPMDGTRIPVDTYVTRQLFDRRRRYECFYVPSYPDELAHIIAHCIFDKQGNFSSYYQSRCDELLTVIGRDGDETDAFRELLSHIFYDAGKLVFELSFERKFDELLPELYAFAEY